MHERGEGGGGVGQEGLGGEAAFSHFSNKSEVTDFFFFLVACGIYEIFIAKLSQNFSK